MQRHVQPGTERLAVDDHLLVIAERAGEFGVLCLDQKSAFVLVGRIQQFQVQTPVDSMPARDRPRSLVAGQWFIKPAVRYLTGRLHRLILPGTA
jgi:hypothetical protein